MSEFPTREPGMPAIPESIFRPPTHVDPTPARARSGHQPRHARAVPKENFWPTIGWTVLGTLVPGVGLLRGGHRVAGGIITGVFVVLLGGLAGLYFGARDQVSLFVTQSSNLFMIAIAVLVLGLIWVVIIGASHLALRRSYPTTGQRAAGAVAVGVLSLAVMGPAAWGADFSYTMSTTVGSIFAASPKTGEPEAGPIFSVAKDPWEDIPRLNVLLLGGDHDKGRSDSLGSRADTVIVASINTKTGATTLFSLPRQTGHMPFPKDSALYKYFPNGFYDGRKGTNPEYMLNAMLRNLPPRVPKDVLGKTPYLGFDAMKLSVGEALGLTIDYFVMVDMDGFKDFINAIGGITVNVNQRVPINGKTTGNVLPTGWIEPGPNKHLSGYMALWYARGRYGLSDYNRMERQRCVINAVAQQANVNTLLTKYQGVASAATQSVTTDIPQSALSPLITLAGRVQGTTLRSIVFQHGKDGFISSNPDFALMRSQVKKALKETDSTNAPKDDATASPTPGSTATPGSTGTPGSTASPSATPKNTQSVDISDACGYHPLAVDPNAGKGTSSAKPK